MLGHSKTLSDLSSGCAHWHKIRNRLEPATNEKLEHVYSNSKTVAATRDANLLKMLAWAVHLMEMHSYNVTTSDPAADAPAGGSQPAPQLGANRPTLMTARPRH